MLNWLLHRCWQDDILAKYVAEANAPQLPDVDARDHQECTPLHVALLHGARCFLPVCRTFRLA